MRYEEINHIWDKREEYLGSKFYYRGMVCYLLELSAQCALHGDGIIYKLRLESEDFSVETGLVSWHAIHDDVEYTPNSVKFIVEEQ